MSGLQSKVSLLIPVYGVERFLERCARSLFEQTYSNIEYVFVNDCTRDRSMDVLERVVSEYPQRQADVKIICHERNRGLSAARNTAVSNSTGKYIMHVDSDDYLPLDAVEVLYGKAAQTGADVVIGNYNRVMKRKITTVIQNISEDHVECVFQMLQKKGIAMWGKLFLREFYIRTGVISVEGLNQGEDYAVMPRLMYYARNIVIVNVSVYNYVTYNSNSYTNNITEKSIRDMLRADEIVETFFKEKPDAEIYRERLELAKLKTALYFSRMASLACLRRTKELYAGFDVQCAGELSTGERIVLRLGRQERFVLLKGLLFVGRLKGIFFR